MILNISGGEDSIMKFTESLANNNYIKEVCLGEASSSDPIEIQTLKETLKDKIDLKIGNAIFYSIANTFTFKTK